MGRRANGHKKRNPCNSAGHGLDRGSEPGREPTRRPGRPDPGMGSSLETLPASVPREGSRLTRGAQRGGQAAPRNGRLTKSNRS